MHLYKDNDKVISLKMIDLTLEEFLEITAELNNMK